MENLKQPFDTPFFLKWEALYKQFMRFKVFLLLPVSSHHAVMGVQFSTIQAYQVVIEKIGYKDTDYILYYCMCF